MARPMTHKWGRKVNPALNSALLSEAAIGRLMAPLHMSVELLPLGLFTREHADHVAMIVNIVAVDSASKGNGMWEVADRVGQVLLAMKARVADGKGWNCTAAERAILIQNITAMDRYVRRWTNRRFTIAAVTVDQINAREKAKGGKFLDRVDISFEVAA